MPAARVAITGSGSSAETDADGSFALDAEGAARDGELAVVVAAHPTHGLSGPRHAAVAANGDTHVGDLVMDRTLGVLTGTVRYAGGSLAGGVEVHALRLDDGDADPDRAVLDVLGVAVEGFDDVFEPTAWGHVVETDAAGRFALLDLRPGRYSLSTGRHGEAQRTVDVGLTASDVELTYGAPNDPGQLFVRIEDRDGRRLYQARYVRHVWHGAAADTAARAYERDGATPALLASAEERDGCYYGFDEWLLAEPDTFTVLGAGAPGAAPAYGACRLAAGQRRGDVRIVLEPLTASGSLRIVARDPAGAPLANVRARFSPVRGERVLPVLVAGLGSAQIPPSKILGRWHAVPADGRVDGLPAGPLFVEVRAAPNADDPWRQPCFLVVEADAQVRAGATTTLDVTCSAGAPMVFELRAPPPRPDERLALTYGEVWVQAEGSAFPQLLHLRPADGGRDYAFVAGRCRVEPLLRFAPGRYTARLRTAVTRERLEPAHDDVPARWVDAGAFLLPGAIEVELGPDSPPIVVELSPH